MKKAILLSVQPKWCELIASGRKTVEVRKTKPKLQMPFKCYIYCTKDNTDIRPKRIWWKSDKTGFRHIMNGKVIGEFLCDKIIDFGNLGTDNWQFLCGDVHEWHKRLIMEKACLSEKEFLAYGGRYGWHISDLVMYDKPKELRFFKKINRDCWYADLGLTKRDCPECQNEECFLQKPPQSWCYVEEA